MTIVQWNGKALEKRVHSAAKSAIDDATGDAASIARRSHWWVNRTNQLQTEIGSEPASSVSGEIVGKFGTSQKRGFYGLFLEHERPFLRPAADAAFRDLGSKIRGRL